MSAANEAFVVVPPMAVTDANLVATSVLENDAPVYNPATSYSLGDQVIYQHVVYESIAAGHTGRTPGVSTSATYWKNARATNRWRLFDGLNSSRTALGSAAFYEIAPGRPINSVAVLSMQGCKSVRVRLTDPVEGLVYDRTALVGRRILQPSWWWWAYGERTGGQTQALFLDLPGYYRNAVLRIDFEGELGAECGLIIFGQQRRFGGGTETGTPSRRRNFSYREFDPDFGDLTIVKRPKAREADFTVWLAHEKVDDFVNFIDSRSDDVTLYIGTPVGGFERLAVVGIPDVPEEENHSTYTICRVPVRGVI